MPGDDQAVEPARRHAQLGLDQPVERVFGVTSSDETSASGHPVVRQELLARALDGRGALPVGAMCILLDHALGHALLADIRDDQRVITSHMHLEVVRAGLSQGPWISGFADEVHVTGTSGFARGRIVDDDRRLVAWSSARFVVIDAAGGEGGRVVPHQAGAPERAQADHPPVAPIDQLLGTQVRSSAGEGVVVSFIASDDLANERGGLHGGVGALMAERAMWFALLATAREDFDLVELRVAFLRPLPASGQEVEAHAEVLMLGRTTAATSARIIRDDGRVAVQVDAIHAHR